MSATVASFAPPVGSRTGVADYAAKLASELRKFTSVTENDVRAGGTALYHLGNNTLHKEIYQQALDRPGAVVLHDAVLTHFLLGLLGDQQWVDEFVYNYGEWHRGFAQQLWRDRARSATDERYFNYGMLRRVAESAKTVIVHNPAAADAVLRCAPEARVMEIPHFFSAPSTSVRDEPRTRFRVGVFGYFRETKRLPSILRAVSKANKKGANVELILAGSFVSADLQRSVGMEATGLLSEEEFWRAARSVDVCVNLRYPSAHETSGIGVSLMGIGKPVIFTAGKELARLAENTHLSVEHGPCEEEALSELLIWLANNPEAAQRIGQNATNHIAKEHSLERVAARYWEVLRTC